MKYSDVYQVCTRCVMDTSDPGIKFDENGICDHCHDFEKVVRPNWRTDEGGRKELDAIIN